MLQSHLGKVDNVLAALEKSRPAVAAHCRRVAAFSVRLAMQYELDRDTIETIRLGALLHDVGKMLIPAKILNKPGRPTEREWEEIKIHPQLGIDVVHRAGFDEDVCEIVLYHHERHDGEGYPDRLAGSAIPLSVRIVSVMDSYDALTSARGYRASLGIEAARTLIARGAGTRYCPWVVSGFLALPPAMLTLPEEGATQDEWREASGPWMSAPDALVSRWQSLEVPSN
jgi:putative nucleotidyltransferase with HDIG domain